MRKLTATALLGTFVGFGMIATTDVHAEERYEEMCIYNNSMDLPGVKRLPADKLQAARIGFLNVEILFQKSIKEKGYLGASLHYAGSFVKSFDGSGSDFPLRDIFMECLHPAVGPILEAVR